MCDAKRDRSGPGPAFWSRILCLLLTGIKTMNRKREMLHMKQLFQLDNHSLIVSPH
uniref:Bm13140 n=1 Tax=Brugia malayi TaxID=6279 RepID=A0A1I9G111_BRUMA|nr:Bm13140 [Brugia malayi]